MACFRRGDAGGGGGEPGGDNVDVLDREPVLCVELFPSREDHSYVEEDLWAGLHSRDQLDFNVSVLGRHHRIEGH